MYGPKAKAETDVNKKRQKKEKEKNFCIWHHKKREREKKRDARHHDNNIDNARVSVERRQIESGDARRLRRERGGVDLLQPGSQKSDCQHFYGASSSVTLSCHFSKWDHNDNARRLPRERPFTKRVERTGEGSRVSRETREIEIESERWPRRRRKKAIDVVHPMVPSPPPSSGFFFPSF